MIALDRNVSEYSQVVNITLFNREVQGFPEGHCCQANPSPMKINSQLPWDTFVFLYGINIFARDNRIGESILFTKNGRHIQILQKRHCQRCGLFTDQVCFSVKYARKEDDPRTTIKRMLWVCSVCTVETEDVKEVPPISDRTKIIQRVLRMQEDYPIESMNIACEPEKLVIEMRI